MSESNPPAKMPSAVEDEESQQSQPISFHSSIRSGPASVRSRYIRSHNSYSRLRGRVPPSSPADERTSLLGNPHSPQSPTHVRRTLSRAYTTPDGAKPRFSRLPSGIDTPLLRTPRHHLRTQSFGAKLASAIQSGWQTGPREGGLMSSSTAAESRAGVLTSDERLWYDQYTSTDWVHDSIADNFRVRDLKERKGFRGRLAWWVDGGQGWMLAAIIGVVVACIAYLVDVTENSVFDIKEGYCVAGWHKSKGKCCLVEEDCPLWRTWGDVLHLDGVGKDTVDLLVYVTFVVAFSVISCLLTLTTKTVVPSNISMPTLDENLGADRHGTPGGADTEGKANMLSESVALTLTGPTVYYPAAGSGVAEVKVILSGFVMHGYLGGKTLVVKTLGLIFSIASGLSLGKEGPFVHIATCVGNIACRLFTKYNHNDGKRREVLSASAASGVAVAFGAPLAGTLFSLEEVSYYFPPKTLFRTFFCCIAAALSLKFLNPYGTGKIVMFEVRYLSDWQFYEMLAFIALGVLGGALGALFIKASKLWARTFRKLPMIKRAPLLEVFIVALLTGTLSFWNQHAKQAVTQLLYELASPCTARSRSNLSAAAVTASASMCPRDASEVRPIISSLLVAFVIKAFLTTITFGIKVPAGIYVPSMAVGGLLGRIVGHALQYLALTYPRAPPFAACALSGGPEACVTPGVYALVAAGATMCGVTRLSVTLAVILFELTGSLDHVLPFSLSVLVAKWTADALEPLSIYDLLTEINHYPFLDNKTHPTFTAELGEITPRLRSMRVIDITRGARVPAFTLRRKLTFLQSAGELDGGLPIVRAGVLVGLVPAPDLEFALDKLQEDDDAAAAAAAAEGDGASGPGEVGGPPPGLRWCMMSADGGNARRAAGSDEDEDNEEEEEDGDGDDADLIDGYVVADLTPYVDPAPVALDIHSPMDLAYQCFVKLGLRYICVLRDGKYAGMVHKKAFVKYIRDLEAGEA